MADASPDIHLIFNEALERESPAERLEYLDQACPDSETRRRVDALLRAHSHAGNFFGGNSPAVATIDYEVALDAIGAQVGPYRIREQIGEGGMGVVFLAEQESPIKRRVALKIVKPGMDTSEVVGRFEAERQALAMMDHPNIAKVLDAGTVGFASGAGPVEDGKRGNGEKGTPAHQPPLTTHDSPPTNPQSEICNLKSEINTPHPAFRTPHSAGRPFFVMELVQGVPITDYCDECQLTTRDRLELFVTVCRAVQHAHQKGVIHRDIKPTNVLVAMQDGRPMPKIIDFGVAKAIGGRLTDRTLTSGFAQLLGTPLYMSPEQAELRPLGVDTRSDVYSLGVLLYELLTGATPFDKDRLHSAPYDEVRRIIREEEPPHPSTRISTLAADAATTVAARRRTDTRRLVQAIRGDLDWIVMKALDKDRNRRYETAADLARDVERYLADEPVHARPPSRLYRARKFVRKHRTGVVAAAAVILVLTLGVVATSLALARAVAERNVARENVSRACELFEQALAPTYIDLAVAADPERRKHRDRLLAHSIRFFESLGQEAQSDPRVRYGLARAYATLTYYRAIDGKDATVAAGKAIDLLEALLEEDSKRAEYLVTLGDLHCDMAMSHFAAGRCRQFADSCAKSVVAIRSALSHDPQSRRALRALVLLTGFYGQSLHACGRFREAEAEFAAALDAVSVLESSQSAESVQSAEAISHDRFAELTVHARYGSLLIDMGRYEEAAAQIYTAARLAEQGVDSEVSESERLLHKLWLAIAESATGELTIVHGNPEGALIHLRRATDLFEPQRAQPDLFWHEYVHGFVHFRRGVALTELGRFDEAISAHQKAEQKWRSLGTPLGLGHAARSKACIGELYYKLGRADEGDAQLAAALDEFKANVTALRGEPIVEALVVFLSTCPNSALRDPEEAVRLADRFQSDCHSNGLFWRYLGLARYRAGDSQGAEEAFHKSMQLRNGADALDWLLLAGSQHQAARHDQAAESFSRAQELIDSAAPIYYGHIGVLGYQRLLAEVHQLLHRASSRHVGELP